jgi:glyoxylate reductase
VDDKPSPLLDERLGAQRVPLSDALAAADVLSIHVPLTPQTRHMIGAAEFAAMKPTAILINTARGPVVDEAALVEALRHKRIAAAGFDVYEHEPRLTPGLAELPNVVLLPHLGSDAPKDVADGSAKRDRSAVQSTAAQPGQLTRPPRRRPARKRTCQRA